MDIIRIFIIFCLFFILIPGLIIPIKLDNYYIQVIIHSLVFSIIYITITKLTKNNIEHLTNLNERTKICNKLFEINTGINNNSNQSIYNTCMGDVDDPQKYSDEMVSRYCVGGGGIPNCCDSITDPKMMFDCCTGRYKVDDMNNCIKNNNVNVGKYLSDPAYSCIRSENQTKCIESLNRLNNNTYDTCETWYGNNSNLLDKCKSHIDNHNNIIIDDCKSNSNKNCCDSITDDTMKIKCCLNLDNTDNQTECLNNIKIDNNYSEQINNICPKMGDAEYKCKKYYSNKLFESYKEISNNTIDELTNICNANKSYEDKILCAKNINKNLDNDTRTELLFNIYTDGDKYKECVRLSDGDKSKLTECLKNKLPVNYIDSKQVDNCKLSSDIDCCDSISDNTMKIKCCLNIKDDTNRTSCMDKLNINIENPLNTICSTIGDGKTKCEQYFNNIDNLTKICNSQSTDKQIYDCAFNINSKLDSDNRNKLFNNIITDNKLSDITDNDIDNLTKICNSRIQNKNKYNCALKINRNLDENIREKLINNIVSTNFNSDEIKKSCKYGTFTDKYSCKSYNNNIPTITNIDINKTIENNNIPDNKNTDIPIITNIDINKSIENTNIPVNNNTNILKSDSDITVKKDIDTLIKECIGEKELNNIKLLNKCIPMNYLPDITNTNIDYLTKICNNRDSNISKYTCALKTNKKLDTTKRTQLINNILPSMYETDASKLRNICNISSNIDNKYMCVNTVNNKLDLTTRKKLINNLISNEQVSTITDTSADNLTKFCNNRTSKIDCALNVNNNLSDINRFTILQNTISDNELKDISDNNVDNLMNICWSREPQFNIEQCYPILTTPTKTTCNKGYTNKLIFDKKNTHTNCLTTFKEKLTKQKYVELVEKYNNKFNADKTNEKPQFNTMLDNYIRQKVTEYNNILKQKYSNKPHKTQPKKQYKKLPKKSSK